MDLPFRSRLWVGAIALATTIGILCPGLASADTGYATWYGPGFQGNTMYNGQRYDMYDPTTTAANIFPLGTWVKVTNPANGHSVVVQVRDRGAFKHALDLSYAAFKAIANPALMGIRVDYVVVSGPSGTPIPPRATPSSRGPRPAPSNQYVVQPGDTLGSIATRTGIDAGKIAAWNSLNDPDEIVVGQVLRLIQPAVSTPKPTATATGTYVVQPGDTVSGIALQFGITVEQLATANNIGDPDSIVVGQTLSIPGSAKGTAAQTYTVQEGDSLSSIADSFGVSIDSLVVANQVADPTLIQPGTKLTIPAH